MAECIEREAALAAVCQYCSAKEDCLPNERCVDYELVNSIPAADAQPVRHGRWIETTQPRGWDDVTCAECSECGEDFVLDEWGMEDMKNLMLYCPNCGARMDRGGNGMSASLYRYTEDCKGVPCPGDCDKCNRNIQSNLFDIEEIHENCTVQILRNSLTGEVSVGWWENEEENNG